MKKIKIQSVEENTCPICGGELDYDTAEFVDDLVYYPYTCLKCGQKGEEYYKMLFVGHNIQNSKGDYIDVDDKVGQEIEI